MQKKRIVWILLGLSLVFTTGCWDHIELNDQAILLGVGIDLMQDRNYRVSGQFVIPSSLGTLSGGGGGKKFFVETGKGKNVIDAINNMQTKIPRKIFRGQRNSIYIGERLARHGIKDILDMFTRSTDLGIRTNISVIKGKQALNMIKSSFPLESNPALASFKLHKFVGETVGTALLDFLKEANSEPRSPSMPTLELVSSSTSQDNLEQGQKYRLSGTALFNKDLKLVGFLKDNEAKYRMWITGESHFQTITTFVPQGAGNITMDVKTPKSDIQPMIDGDKLKFTITLTGKGIVRENNTKLDLIQIKNIKATEDALNKETEKHVAEVIKKVQKNYRTDVFGFGDAIFRRYPSEWRKLENKWTKEFSKADVSVKVNLEIQSIGLTGSPVQLEEKQIKK